ncbi:MAG: hypothetical protein HYZ63_02530 [Candidatus Andersenbacteria bacterium]|nr:hypothetical protein [Candidatus Andersenbacteria bacterium]
MEETSKTILILGEGLPVSTAYYDNPTISFTLQDNPSSLVQDISLGEAPAVYMAYESNGYVAESVSLMSATSGTTIRGDDILVNSSSFSPLQIYPDKQQYVFNAALPFYTLDFFVSSQNPAEEACVVLATEVEAFSFAPAILLSSTISHEMRLLCEMRKWRYWIIK